MSVNETIDLRGEIKNRLVSDWTNYQKLIYSLSLDGPIGALCLPARIERELIRSGCLRIYDMVDRDFVEIETLTERELALVRTRVDEFLAML